MSRRASDDGRPWTLVVGLVAAVLLIGLAELKSRPPAAVSADAPADQFSAERAITRLEDLLGRQRPHPAGTAANRGVKKRLIRQLEELDVEVEEQHAVGCSLRGARCAFTENVIATLAGRSDDTIVLMAHYDSVPPAPGAGDDGAGVAALVEVLAMVRDGAPYQNTLQWVLTDAEEVGLLGAEAYFSQYPGVDRVKVVINVEGSGSAGPVNLLRSTLGSGSLVHAFRRASDSPVANSMATEIFKRMPNDTDFSVAMASDIKGIDFAFAGERNHYHTPNDTIENLSRDTMQHHGDNVLPLLRRLADADLGEISGEYSYSTQLGLWVMWPQWLTLPLAVVALVLLLAAIVIQRRSVKLRRVAAGLALSLVGLVAMVLVNAVGLWLLGRIAGATPSWPATVWPWRLTIFAATLLGWVAAVAPLARRVGATALWSGAWLIVAALAVFLGAVAPLAANPFLIPAFGAGVIRLFAAIRNPEGDAGWTSFLVIVSAGLGAVYLGGLMPLLEASQGYGLAPAVYVLAALTLMLSSPLLAVAPRSQPATLAAFALGVLVVAAVGVAVLPLYSPYRPQHLNFSHIQNHDEKQAWWLAMTAGELPEAVRSQVGFGPAEAILPGTPNAAGETATAPWLEVPPPEFEIVDDVTEASAGPGRRVRLKLRSPRRGNEIQLLVNREAGLESMKVESREVAVTANPQLRARFPDHDVVSVVVPPGREVELTLRLGSTDSHEHLLADVSHGLPSEGRGLSDARSPNGSPVHRGDQQIVYRSITF